MRAPPPPPIGIAVLVPIVPASQGANGAGWDDDEDNFVMEWKSVVLGEGSLESHRGVGLAEARSPLDAGGFGGIAQDAVMVHLVCKKQAYFFLKGVDLALEHGPGKVSGGHLGSSRA
jgi:hypothetical protein